MKRFFAAVVVAIALSAAACGTGSTATPSPTSNEPAGNLVDNPQSNFLKPADKARDTANKVSNQLNQDDQNSGSNMYNP